MDLELRSELLDALHHPIEAGPIVGLTSSTANIRYETQLAAIHTTW
jgi:hypothetical protein